MPEDDLIDPTANPTVKAVESRATAEQTLDFYAELTGAQSEDTETRITDLLADLMHLCDRQDIVFDSLVAAAERHYEEEIR